MDVHTLVSVAIRQYREIKQESVKLMGHGLVKSLSVKVLL